MSRFQPPSSLLFLQTLFRPHLLRPDIRVPGEYIGHVDYRALRRAGFNAVVIDKDNCLTYPERDSLHPPLQSAWAGLLAAFEPGRVLVVSNSAGVAKKDPGGLAAESVSYHLRTPVLLHAHPKPACALPILQYFRAELPGPTTLAARLRAELEAGSREVQEDKEEFIRRFRGVAEGPLLGELRVSDDGGVGGRDLIDPFTPRSARAEGPAARGERDGSSDAAKDSIAIESAPSPSSASGPWSTSPIGSRSTIVKPTETADPPGAVDEPLRILVIGDRLFTDTLLAHRLRHLLSSFPAPRTLPTTEDSALASMSIETVISIQTTLLPDPKDVRFLRWVESKLSRNRLRQGQNDWGRYVLRSSEPDAVAGAVQGQTESGWRRFLPFRAQWLAALGLGWSPRTWTFWGLLRGTSRSLGWAVVGMGRGGRWAWVRGKRWVDGARARRRARMEQEQEKGAPAPSTAPSTADPKPQGVIANEQVLVTPPQVRAAAAPVLLVGGPGAESEISSRTASPALPALAR